MLELLAPAGNIDCANAAIDNGADAIYLGLVGFSARQGADNFDGSTLLTVLEKAHFCGVKVYVAMNTIVKDGELEGFFSELVAAWNMGVDAIILQDIFLGKLVKERYPEIILHLSTQAGVCTVEGARLAKEYGFSRVVPARETPIDEVAEIAQIIETEAFVQGALCTAYSGQCYFSSFVGGNSGNRGRCKQPCRKQYAYDRNGENEMCYALSLSDLSVGESIDKYIDSGVTSFKIEGRMRRPEYVAAAVRYYRQIIDEGRESAAALSDLKRAYNRGNYTKGLAFGQDKRLLSTAIQGHIGEKVGVVKVVGGKFLVESALKPSVGDAFKILRDGVEIGGASYVKTEGRSFVISSKIRLKNGDGVFITTDTAVNQRVLANRRKGSLSIELYFQEGMPAMAKCGDIVVTGELPLQSAQSRPLTEEELKTCFLKTDGLPAEITFSRVQIVGNIFIPKSELNAFRREFYAEIIDNTGKNIRYGYSPVEFPVFEGKCEKTAVIATDFTHLSTDIAVYKAKDFSADLPDSFTKGAFEKYFYLPPFVTRADLATMRRQIEKYRLDGVYAETYSGVEIAKEWGVKLFAGTGFHLLNGLSVKALLEETCLSYYALSKEGTKEELKGLISEKAFVFSTGDIKLMDLCYCPFGKTCNRCDKRETYRLTDEGGRVFPVRRYLSSEGNCRFEVYNCAALIGTGLQGAGALLDLSVTEDREGVLVHKDSETEQKKRYTSYTSGHFHRGVL